MASKQQDPRLGQFGGIDTKVCAVTGHAVSDGMQRFALQADWYFRVKPSRVHLVDEKLKAELTALIPAKETSKKEESK